MAASFIRVTAFGSTGTITIHDAPYPPSVLAPGATLNNALQRAALRMLAENGGTVRAGLDSLRESGYAPQTQGVTDAVLNRAL